MLWQKVRSCTINDMKLPNAIKRERLNAKDVAEDDESMAGIGADVGIGAFMAAR